MKLNILCRLRRFFFSLRCLLCTGILSSPAWHLPLMWVKLRAFRLINSLSVGECLQSFNHLRNVGSLAIAVLFIVTDLSHLLAAYRRPDLLRPSYNTFYSLSTLFCPLYWNVIVISAFTFSKFLNLWFHLTSFEKGASKHLNQTDEPLWHRL